jgi:signal recognition particle receptor subunit alpha
MLDAFYIFTKGGLVLFSYQLAALRGEPVDALVRGCLLEERGAQEGFAYTAPDGAAYALKWAFHNEAALVFVAVRRARRMRCEAPCTLAQHGCCAMRGAA